MSDNKPRRKLAAILAADVVGFSKMMSKETERYKTLKHAEHLQMRASFQTMEEFLEVREIPSLPNLQVL